jgi:acyl-CoA hydrolase
MARRMTADEAAGLFEPTDTFAMPLGPGQPAALLEAMGKRDDWEELRIGTALLFVFTPLFNHPNVHYLSGFFGPIERVLRDSGANISFAPADFRRFEPILEEQHPRVMATVAAPPDNDGWCSLSLHAGSTYQEFLRIADDPQRLLMVEVSDLFPRTQGHDPDYRHALHLDQIDVLIESDKAPLPLEDPPPGDAERAIAEHASRYVHDGTTLQTGIGAIPSTIAGLLAHGDGGDYGVHTEMFTTGLMQLHEAGKVTNARKGQYDGVSVATFAGGTQELYEWLDENPDVAFMPVEIVNSPDVIARNHRMVTINGALSIDIHGQAVADTINGAQFSGIGGHEDFVAGPALALESQSLLCMTSTYTVDGKRHSRIVPWFDVGAVITAPRHAVDVIVTEYGAAELQGKTVHQRGEALAAVAHPDYRDELLAAAERASHGHSPFADGR